MTTPFLQLFMLDPKIKAERIGEEWLPSSPERSDMPTDEMSEQIVCTHGN